MQPPRQTTHQNNSPYTHLRWPLVPVLPVSKTECTCDHHGTRRSEHEMQTHGHHGTRTKQKTDLSQIMQGARVNSSMEAAQVAGRIQSLFTAHQITKDMSERTAPRAGGALSSPARSCRAEEAAARAMSSPLQPPFVLCACKLSGRQNQLAPW